VEIAPDTNLKLSKFIAIAELLSDYARVVDDVLYKAIDIYLKAQRRKQNARGISLYCGYKNQRLN